MIQYQWASEQPEYDPYRAQVDQVFKDNNWALLNDRTHRILYAIDPDFQQLTGFIVLQLFPHTEPLWVHPDWRGTELATELSSRMLSFMQSIDARGFIAIADSPHAAKLCEQFGMKRIESPVYIL